MGLFTVALFSPFLRPLCALFAPLFVPFCALFCVSQIVCYKITAVLFEHLTSGLPPVTVTATVVDLTAVFRIAKPLTGRDRQRDGRGGRDYGNGLGSNSTRDFDPISTHTWV
jgi:hypothetical protein